MRGSGCRGGNELSFVEVGVGVGMGAAWGLGMGKKMFAKVDPSNVNNGCDVNVFVFNNQQRLIVIARWITKDLTPGKPTNNSRKSVTASIDNIRVKLKGQCTGHCSGPVWRDR